MSGLVLPDAIFCVISDFLACNVDQKLISF